MVSGSPFSSMPTIVPLYKRYTKTVAKIKEKMRARKTLLAEKKALSPLQIISQHQLSGQIATLTEEINELKNQKQMLIREFHMTDDEAMKKVSDWITSAETSLQACEINEAKYGEDLEKASAEYREIEKRLSSDDQQAVRAIRQVIRQDTNQNIAHRIQEAAGSAFDGAIMVESKNRVNDILSEGDEAVIFHFPRQQDKQNTNKERGEKDKSGTEISPSMKNYKKNRKMRC